MDTRYVFYFLNIIIHSVSCMHVQQIMANTFTQPAYFSGRTKSHNNSKIHSHNQPIPGRTKSHNNSKIHSQNQPIPLEEQKATTASKCQLFIICCSAAWEFIKTRRMKLSIYQMTPNWQLSLHYIETNYFGILLSISLNDKYVIKDRFLETQYIQ